MEKKIQPLVPLRLWPGVVLVALQWLARFVLPALAPDLLMVGVLAGLAGGLLVLIWWLVFSRAAWGDRLSALGVIAAGSVGTHFLLHESVATGNMGLMFPIFVAPVLSLALVVWAAWTRTWRAGPRRVVMVVVLLLACVMWTAVRTGGNTADFDHDFAWRWQPTAEEKLLAESSGERPTGRASIGSDDGVGPAWTAFRGPRRDSIVRGTRVDPDWAALPPTETWRRSVGPGWSSFAVLGDWIYTQEQRGENEVVSCYRLADGEPVWRHEDAARFWESVGGAGPRGTPTLHDGRVYALGATGLLNVLDARDGTEIWSRNTAQDTGTEIPEWGYSGSPWVTDDQVLVASSGVLVSYDLNTGEPRWQGPSAGEGYSSPHWVTLDGVEQVLHLNGEGLVSLAPTDGEVLWSHDWSGYPIVQPALAADGVLLLSVTSSSGTRRVDVSRTATGWNVEEKWTSNGLKSYFNDFVIHKGHAYGFDGSILAAISLADGKRKWKGGRYGGGQLLLLADQDLLLVLSEKGELALVNATPDGFMERARHPAIEGKTWNHPVLVGDTLLVRNAEEMAAFQLTSLETD